MKRTISVTLAALTCGILVAGSTAYAEKTTPRDNDRLEYEFEFRYDRDDLRHPDGRRDMNRRLRDRADAYCAKEMPRHREACRRAVYRDVSARVDEDLYKERRDRY